MLETWAEVSSFALIGAVAICLQVSKYVEFVKPEYPHALF